MAKSPAYHGGGPVRLTLYSNGAKLGESVQVVSVTVNRAINRIPYAKLVLLDGDMPGKDFPVSDSADFQPGAEIRISAGYGQREETLFEGLVVRHGIKISGNNEARLLVECRDKACKLTVGRKNANYVDAKDSDIIARLIDDAGLSSDVAASATQYTELVQYYATDWDFLLARAEANGFLVVVEDGKLTVRPPDTSAAPELQVTYGQDIHEFHADVDAMTQLATVKGVSWDLKSQAVVVGQEGPQRLNAQGDLDAATLAKVIGLDSYRLQTAAPLEQAALKDWAKARQIKAGLSRIQGRMKFQGSAKAKVGKLIALEGVGKRFNGKVYVSAVQHAIADGDWVTEVEFGMRPDWFAERRDLVAPPASGLTPGVEGLQIGVVKKLDADPEGQHKVQVSVPVMQAESEGVWARLSRFYASDGIGAFFIPEIGDEVVLGYFNNDPANPVILGSLYSSKRKPPYDLTAENNIKALVTRSLLKLEFDEDKKVITLLTPANNTIVLSDDGKSILIQDQNNNKILLDPGGITLDSPKDIKISAKGTISIDAVGQISVTSKADVKVSGLNVNNEAQIGYVAKGGASAELSAAGQTTVKGAMVMIN
jgi:Rhs element Vgr protein